MIPDGYKLAETDERVDSMGFRYFRWRAERLKQEFPPIVPSYYLTVEKAGFLRYEVVAYQNVLVPVDG